MNDNELIAEFMGFKFAFERGHRIYYVPSGEDAKYKAFKLAHVKFLYDSSWDWLIPVVEKIAENYDFTIQFYDGNCNCYCTKQNLEESDIPGVGHGGFKPHIQSVYKSVVAFVKWHKSIQK